MTYRTSQQEWGAGAARQSGRAPRRRRSGCGALLLALLIVVAVLTLVFGLLMVGYASVARDLPMPDELQARVSHFNSTLIYDRAGGLLSEVSDPNYGRRTVVPLNQISPYLVDGTIATEDPNFYLHPGVDPVGMARMFYYAVKERSLGGPGGSTITQQLVKLTFLSPERTISRKVKEAILATEITRRYDKDTILQIYLNEIPYGNLAYGIEAASETYFGKHAADLTLAEAAMLAGLPQAPSYYDPYTRLWNADGSPGIVKERQGTVLRLLVQHNFVTSDQADAAWLEPLLLKPLRQTYTMQYPHFVQHAQREVESIIGPELMTKGGLRIYTTLDPRIQAIAEAEVANELANLVDQHATNAAALVVQPQTGEILAMVGSADFQDEAISGQINMALAPRQPGSAIKPFTYLTAFEMPEVVSPETADPTSGQISAIEPPGYWAPATAIMDIRTEFPDGANPPYVPNNYGGDDQDVREHGLISVRSALASSYNIPAVKTLEHVGLERLKDVVLRAGITTLTRPDYGLSLTLGGGDVTLLELTGAYATLANAGTRVPLSPIACVVDQEGYLIWRGAGAERLTECAAAQTLAGGASVMTPEPAQTVFNSQHVYLITNILSDLDARRPAFGASAPLLGLPDRPVAAKTGTTNDNRDAWTLGYTPDLVVGVWVGNADYTPMQGVTGVRGAAPIWHAVFARSLENSPPQPFVEPPGIQRVSVCADSGTLPSEACQTTKEEVFAAGQGPLPAQFDLHQRVRVDRVTGQLATEFTPGDRIETRDIMNFPPRYRAWAEEHGFAQFDLAAQNYAFEPELALVGPGDGSVLAGVVEITGRVAVPQPLVWRLEYGVGPNPIGWGVIAGPNISALDGTLASWETTAAVARHNVTDFSLRIAAYDPANAAYPVAVSNTVYVRVERPPATATTVPTFTPEPRPTDTPTNPPTAAIPTPLPSATPPATETPVPPASPTQPSPTQGPPATATGMATSPTPQPTAQASGAVRAVITAPLEDSEIWGDVEILGFADGPGFVSYQLSYGVGAALDSVVWQSLDERKSMPRSGEVLGVWRTGTLSPGLYWLRLQVSDANGQETIVRVQVLIRSPGG